jgi:hypothetical protein
MKKLSVLVNSKDSKADADDATTKSLTVSKFKKKILYLYS